MVLISHRGNINGKLPSEENKPEYIDKAISENYDVEIDIWVISGNIWLGHDEPQYPIEFRWLRDRMNRLWIHCKNLESVVYLSNCRYDLNYFWHENDKVTLTSKKHIWAYPGKQPIKGSIAVMPEINNDDITSCIGVCSDNIENYKK